MVYSKEYLSELRASTQSVPSPSRVPGSNGVDSEMVLDASEAAGAVIVGEEMTSGKDLLSKGGLFLTYIIL